MLQARELSKVYRQGDEEIVAVESVSFEANAGEFVAIVGPSGSGKTTLLAMLGALLTPSSGEIDVGSVAIHELDRSGRARFRRSTVGYVFQANNLIPFLTARENLLIISSIGGTTRRLARARADVLLGELGLSHRRDALATDLSGGERQRVAIARALMNDPELLLVDEPTAALDSARGEAVVSSLVSEVKARGALGLMVTHDQEMAALADRTLTLHDGRLTSSES